VARTLALAHDGENAMGDIVDFPGFDERVLRQMLASVEAILRQTALPAGGRAWVLSETERRIRVAIPSFGRIAFSIPALPGASAQAVEAAGQIAVTASKEHFQTMLLGLVKELVLVLTQLYVR